jgi:acetylornithine deacetylase/succinyl-diaminopimelate desuccinylase-like protein
MRSLRRRLTILLSVIFFVVAPFNCGRAGGEQQDPLDREAVDALLSYLRVDTTNPPGNETGGARFLQSLFQKNGLQATLVGSDPRRQSLYLRMPSGTNEKALLLLHHIDVVPAGPDWTKPAFAGLQSGGYIWGRGALDIKSLGIAEAFAMIDLQRRHAPLGRDVIYLAVADEELGGVHGCKELIEQHPDLFRNVGYVLNEGGYNETVVDYVTFWGIEVQQKLPLWIELHAKGEGRHAASPPDDGGALAKLVRALAAVQRIPTPYRLTGPVQESFHEAGRGRPDERGEVLRSIATPLDVARIERVLSPAYRSLLRDTIAITRVSGGTSVNAVPSAAAADLDIRLLPDETPDAMLAEVREAVGKNADVNVLLSTPPVAASPANTDLFRVLSAAMRRQETRSSVGAIVGAGTTDSRYFRARGIVAYGVAPFKVNFYDAPTVHAADERIRERFFTEGVRLMRSIVSDFCTRTQ